MTWKCATPTVLITRHQSCASRGRVRRTNASRFAHASSRLRIAPHHPTCSSFYSTHRSPAYAACCTALCKRHAREPSRGPGQCIWKQDGAQNHAPRTLFPDCESPRTIPHALPFTPLIAHQLVQLVAQHLASEVHGSSCSAEEGGFRITMECIIAVLKPPLLVTCGDAAAARTSASDVNK